MQPASEGRCTSCTDTSKRQAAAAHDLTHFVRLATGARSWCALKRIVRQLQNMHSLPILLHLLLRNSHQQVLLQALQGMRQLSWQMSFVPWFWKLAKKAVWYGVYIAQQRRKRSPSKESGGGAWPS